MRGDETPGLPSQRAKDVPSIGGQRETVLSVADSRRESDRTTVGRVRAGPADRRSISRQRRRLRVPEDHAGTSFIWNRGQRMESAPHHATARLLFGYTAQIPSVPPSSGGKSLSEGSCLAKLSSRSTECGMGGRHHLYQNKNRLGLSGGCF